MASPIRFGEGALAGDREAPRLSGHTEEVLAGELGLAPEEIAQLREAGVIQGDTRVRNPLPGETR